MAVRIVIAGDVVPMGRSERPLLVGDAHSVFGDLMEEFEAADLVTANLECPFITQESPIEKDGPVLGAHPDCIRGLKNAHIGLLNLGNNHILDHGEEGLRCTIETCANAGIAHVGAGANIGEAGKPFVRQLDGTRVAVLSVADREFSIAGQDSAGANPLDLIDYVRFVREARNRFDFLIVLYHGGKEHYPYPSPRLMKTCRFMVDEGAGAVLCQHSHCAGCVEDYGGGSIVYGQGNLVFDLYPHRGMRWHQGFLVVLEVDGARCSRMSTVPYVQFHQETGVRKMTGHVRRDFLRDLQSRSDAIHDEAFVEATWRAMCSRQRGLYQSRLRGHGRLLRGLNRVLHFTELVPRAQAKLTMRNVVECEAHREVLETVWKEDDIKRRKRRQRAKLAIPQS